MAPGAWQLLADGVLALHAALVAFVVFGLLLVVGGNQVGWHWVNAWWFRLAHAIVIACVVAESWFGVTCPLTTLESSLRHRAHAATYDGSFVEHWLQRAIFYDAPPWVFVLAYTLFGLAVAAAWWRYPPRR